MIKVSIIVPIYNVENYLSNCLDSLLEQDLDPSEYEIICINDGATDRSKEILLRYAQDHSNIVAITQENQGVSVARNSGIDAAKGEYVLFVDGDDRLYPNVLQKLYQHAKNNTLDLLYLHVDYFDENDNCTGSFIMDDESGKIVDGFYHQRRGFIFGLYRSAMLSNIRFEKEVTISEDALFNIIVHSVAKRCSYLSIPAYKYLIRIGSALKSDVPLKQEAFLGYLKFIDVLANYVEKNKIHYSKEQIQYFDRPFYKVSEMALLSNIIPNLSVSRYTALRLKIKERQLNIVEEELKKSIPFYGTYGSIFIGYQMIIKAKNSINS
jgi:glycosyltransferase involved in cell wall biosynthesis